MNDVKLYERAPVTDPCVHEQLASTLRLYNVLIDHALYLNTAAHLNGALPTPCVKSHQIFLE